MKITLGKTHDGKLVEVGDRVWVISSTGVEKCTVEAAELVTTYEMGGRRVLVKHSFSTKKAARIFTYGEKG